MKINAYYDLETTEYNQLNEEEQILKHIEIAKKAMESVYKNFDFVTEPELIDSCIYELKALQLKYQYLINQAKALNIIAKIQ